MPIVTLDYDEFSALCDRLLGGVQKATPRPPRRFSRPEVMQCRFRGRWFDAGGGLAFVLRPGLRQLGFPRSRDV